MNTSFSLAFPILAHKVSHWFMR